MDAEQRVDAGMMLDGQHVQAEVVAQQELVDHLLEQVGGDLRVAVAVGQAGAHGIRRVEHILRHEGIRHLALPPSVHRVSPVAA